MSGRREVNGSTVKKQHLNAMDAILIKGTFINFGRFLLLNLKGGF